MTNFNKRCPSATGVGFSVQCLLCDGHPGPHKYNELQQSFGNDPVFVGGEPPDNFDHDPRFGEGGEFHKEANPPLGLKDAQGMIGQVQLALSHPYLDKEAATVILAQAYAILEFLQEPKVETEAERKARKIKCLRAQADYVEGLLGQEYGDGLRTLALMLEKLP